MGAWHSFGSCLQWHESGVVPTMNCWLLLCILVLGSPSAQTVSMKYTSDGNKQKVTDEPPANIGEGIDYIVVKIHTKNRQDRSKFDIIWNDIYEFFSSIGTISVMLLGEARQADSIKFLPRNYPNPLSTPSILVEVDVSWFNSTAGDKEVDEYVTCIYNSVISAFHDEDVEDKPTVVLTWRIAHDIRDSFNQRSENDIIEICPHSRPITGGN